MGMLEGTSHIGNYHRWHWQNRALAVFQWFTLLRYIWSSAFHGPFSPYVLESVYVSHPFFLER